MDAEPFDVKAALAHKGESERYSVQNLVGYINEKVTYVREQAKRRSEGKRVMGVGNLHLTPERSEQELKRYDAMHTAVLRGEYGGVQKNSRRILQLLKATFKESRIGCERNILTTTGLRI